MTVPIGSFKGAHIRPPRYRTPSPPREAVEPVTPSAIDHAANSSAPALAQGGVQGSQTKEIGSEITGSIKQRNDQDTMNAFALIALATSPPAPSHSGDKQSSRTIPGAAFENSHQDAHVSKRAKSEKLASPEWHRIKQGTESRPTTSYHVQAQTSTSDAELLLNFSQVARSSPALHYFHRHTKSDQTNAVSSPQKPAHGAVVQHPLSRSHDQMGHREVVRNNGVAANGRSEDHGLITSKARKQPRDNSLSQDTSKVPILPTQAQLEPALGEQITEKMLPSTHSPSRLAINSSSASTFTRQAQTPSASPTRNGTEDIENAQPIMADGYSTEKAEKSPSTEDSEREQLNVEEPNDFREGFLQRQMVANEQVEAQLFSQIPVDATTAASKSGAAGSNDQNLLPRRSAASISICVACKFSRNLSSMDSEYNATSWISCDACKSWFHFACAGFKNEREVRGVDKYRCKGCRPVHGPTTFVRKSARAHTAIDYAGLNEGVVKTSDERPEHHYIKPIKDGTITFSPESFPRMPPELVTADFLERSYGWKEPIVVPAALNPQPEPLDSVMRSSYIDDSTDSLNSPTIDSLSSEDPSFSDNEYEAVPEHEQDALDMVMPRNLTVRQVAELYGPEEKVEVIDVKSQNGETKKWNMRRWADYYESSGSKIVRNVISLEVSQSKLGRLIRRPQVVRDLDLQDSVWPAELRAKGEIPRVQFYCLMSVADCFTDFHIDFGGSSVFYHIIRGKKTFLFIPPKEKHLKKYEEWCKSPAQNWTFLADQTKECYRVDLSPGDTMFIPAGWIHAVWTPEDSLVIGGNFLTRMNYGMQFKIAQLEKTTGVARKFRYPHFQKLHWYAALKYLQEDPLPDSVRDLLQKGGAFHRQSPAHHDFDIRAQDPIARPEAYHARYYSQSELEGLPELIRYLLRTALIDNGNIIDGVTQETRSAVKKSIPRGHGEPLDMVKNLALWCAWKRGNEEIPPWAYPGAVPDVPEAPEKLSAAAQKRMDKEAALQAPRRQSARKQLQQHVTDSDFPALEGTVSSKAQDKIDNVSTSSKLPSDQATTPVQGKASASTERDADHIDYEHSTQKPRTSSGLSSGSRRKIACDTCRQRRRACKHKIFIRAAVSSQENENGLKDPGNAKLRKPKYNNDLPDYTAAPDLHDEQTECESDSDTYTAVGGLKVYPDATHARSITVPSSSSHTLRPTSLHSQVTAHQPPQKPDNDLHYQSASSSLEVEVTIGNLATPHIAPSISTLDQSRGRAKACADCRKSKRRCIHDELGNEDPVKAKEAAMPRPVAAHKRKLAKETPRDTPGKRRLMGANRDKMHIIEMKPASLSPSALLDTLTHSADCSSMTEDLPPTQSPKPIPNGSGEDQPSASEPALASTSTELIELAERPVFAEVATSDTDPVNYNGAAIPSPIVESEELHTSGAAAAALTHHIPLLETQGLQSNSVLTLDTDVGYPSDSMLTMGPSATGAAAHSLASPPPSSKSPSARNGASPSEPSTRHSSRHLKTIERYTPSSESARRTSNSSAGGVGDTRRASSQSTSPLTSVATNDDLDEDRREKGGQRWSQSTTPLAAKGKKDIRLSSEGADEETMRLIQELQAQEHGLRRRGKG